MCRRCTRVRATEARLRTLSVQQGPQRLWSPGVAALLSCLVPGAGQLYKRNVGEAFLWLIFVVMGYTFFILSGLALHVMCVATAASGNPWSDPGVTDKE